jgi:hypothetical protein
LEKYSGRFNCRSTHLDRSPMNFPAQTNVDAINAKNGLIASSVPICRNRCRDRFARFDIASIVIKHAIAAPQFASRQMNDAGTSPQRGLERDAIQSVNHRFSFQQPPEQMTDSELRAAMLLRARTAPTALAVRLNAAAAALEVIGKPRSRRRNVPQVVEFSAGGRRYRERPMLHRSNPH